MDMTILKPKTKRKMPVDPALAGTLQPEQKVPSVTSPGLVNQPEQPKPPPPPKVPPTAMAAPAGPDPTTGIVAAPATALPSLAAQNAARFLDDPGAQGGGAQGGAGGGTAAQQAARDAARAQDEADLESQRDPGAVQADQDANEQMQQGMQQGRTQDQLDAERLAELTNDVNPASGGGGGNSDDPYAGTNDKIQAVIDRLLAGDVDTAEAERLMQEQSDRDLGAGIVDSRARSGRGGWNMSGSQMALEGDIRSKNALETSQRLLDYRTKEDQRAKDNAIAGIGSELDMRDWASADELTRRRLDLMQQMLGLDESGAPAGNPPAGIDDPNVEKAKTEVGDDGVIRPTEGYKNPFSSIAQLLLAYQNGELSFDEFSKLWDSMQNL